MPPSRLSISAKPLSGRTLSFAEREEIALSRAQDRGVREIARRLGRAPSTISRELRERRGHPPRRPRVPCLDPRSGTACRAARRPRASKLAGNEAPRRTVEDRLAGRIARADGTEVPGPQVAWTKRRSVRRQHRRRRQAWSPEQISARLEVDFPEDEAMRISPEAI